jgi:phospholipid N-methyltransferase
MREALSFFQQFWDAPSIIGSAIPTFPWSARQIANGVPEERWKDNLRISEYGPGTGVVTAEIARRMSANSQLVIIELRQKFVDDLRRKFSHDDRVQIIHGNAADADRLLRPYGKVDFNFDMIPMSMPDDDRRKIQHVKKATLEPDGSSFVSLFRSRTRKYLEEVFPYVAYRGISLLNILPLRRYEARPVIPSDAAPLAAPTGEQMYINVAGIFDGVIAGRT